MASWRDERCRPGARSRLRIRAPELIGKGGRLDAGGDALTLADPLSKIVLLGFQFS
ncbi:hypothetical protein [Streptomyces termitum]|uniref:hypothetical protein n=1 Tax=Streptomyces termitum TaxID=67368 RepID=UPI0033A61549